MKVLILNGSPRAKGSTSALLHMIENELVSNEFEFDFFDLGNIRMSHCKGCSSCYRTGRCIIDDDAKKISQMIGKADGIVIGSPTYASNVSGVMKDFIDRGHFVIEQRLHDKYCITVATGENYGSRDALKVMDNLVLFSGGKLCCHLRVRTPLNDELQSAKRISGRMINAMQRKKMFPVQKLIHAFIFNFGIRPFVKRKGTAYSGVAEKWERLGIL